MTQTDFPASIADRHFSVMYSGSIFSGSLVSEPPLVLVLKIKYGDGCLSVSRLVALLPYLVLIVRRLGHSFSKTSSNLSCKQQ